MAIGIVRRSLHDSSWLAAVVGLLFAFCAATTRAQSRDAFPLPRVSDPIPVTASSYPQLAADRSDPVTDLSKLGYVEEERFLSGTANIYEHDADGNVVVKTPNAPYTGRILLRRPKDPARSSGTVVVEILNWAFPDSSPLWNYSHGYFLAHGDVWIGVTARPSNADQLKKFNPKRYATLSWPQTSCNGAPPKSDYGVLWDILSQVAALVRSQSPSNPLKDLALSKVYLTGMSGGDMPTFVITMHPVESRAYGRPIFDGYLIKSSGLQLPLNQCESLATRENFIVPPRGVPVISLQTETDVVPMGGWQTRRPDSDTASDRYRLYEVPGATHIDLEVGGHPADASRAASGELRSPLQERCIEKVPLSAFPLHYTLDGAFANLDRWARDGIAPPKAKRIDLVIKGDPPRATAVTDSFGNALGGVRTPFVDLPTATYHSARTGSDFLCRMIGYETPFDQERLKALYPSLKDYADRVSRQVDQMLKDHWLTEADAQQLKADAPSLRHSAVQTAK
jgi:hypothetical protein